jgi:hypothetical protein
MPAPNKVGEYLQWGLVIVASRLPFLEQLETRGVGEMVDALDAPEIARAVRRAVERARTPVTRGAVQRVSREWMNMQVQAAPILEFLRGRGTAAER